MQIYAKLDRLYSLDLEGSATVRDLVVALLAKMGKRNLEPDDVKIFRGHKYCSPEKTLSECGITGGCQVTVAVKPPTLVEPEVQSAFREQLREALELPGPAVIYIGIGMHRIVADSEAVAQQIPDEFIDHDEYPFVRIFHFDREFRGYETMISFKLRSGWEPVKMSGSKGNAFRLDRRTPACMFTFPVNVPSSELQMDPTTIYGLPIAELLRARKSPYPLLFVIRVQYSHKTTLEIYVRGSGGRGSPEAPGGLLDEEGRRLLDGDQMYAITRVDPGGDCIFAALHQQGVRPGEVNSAATLRQYVAARLAGAAAARVAVPNAYVDTQDLAAVADVLGIRIVLYEAHYGASRWHARTVSGAGGPEHRILLRSVKGEQQGHYDALGPAGGSSGK